MISRCLVLTAFFVFFSRWTYDCSLDDTRSILPFLASLRPEGLVEMIMNIVINIIYLS